MQLEISKTAMGESGGTVPGPKEDQRDGSMVPIDFRRGEKGPENRPPGPQGEKEPENRPLGPSLVPEESNCSEIGTFLSLANYF